MSHADNSATLARIVPQDLYLIQITRGQPTGMSYRLVLRDMERHQVSEAIRVARWAKDEYRLPVKVLRIPAATREEEKILVTIGACATAGGIQALRNFADVAEYAAVVYARPDYITSLATSTPIADHVRVDFELRGCPINKWQLVEVVSAYLNGRKPNIPSYSVCIECKRKGNVCTMVATGATCLGPVTQAGCGALCPSYNRGCYACFGPKDAPNPASLAKRFEQRGVSTDDVRRAFRGFNAYAEPFRKQSEAYEK